jgi:hypothetical protein
MHCDAHLFPTNQTMLRRCGACETTTKSGIPFSEVVLRKILGVMNEESKIISESRIELLVLPVVSRRPGWYE